MQLAALNLRSRVPLVHLIQRLFSEFFHWAEISSPNTGFPAWSWSKWVIQCFSVYHKIKLANSHNVRVSEHMAGLPNWLETIVLHPAQRRADVLHGQGRLERRLNPPQSRFHNSHPWRPAPHLSAYWDKCHSAACPFGWQQSGVGTSSRAGAVGVH